MIGPIGHVDEVRLGTIAEGSSMSGAEGDHLDTCARCRRLLDGHRLAFRVLTGPWVVHEAGTDVATGNALNVQPVRVAGVRSRGGQQRWVLPAVAVVGLLVVAGMWALMGGGPTVTDDPANRVVVVPTPTQTVIPATTMRPGSPVFEGGTVLRVDAASGDILDAIAVPGLPGLVTTAGGSVWAMNFADGSVVRIDPVSRAVVTTIEFDRGAAAILGDGDDLWVAADTHDLVRIDARTGREIARYTLAEDELFRTGDAGFLAIVDEDVWITVPDLQAPAKPHGLWRFDPVTGTVRSRLSIDRDPHPPIVVGDSIFYVSPFRSTVIKVDTSSMSVESRRVDDEAYAIAYGAGSLWVGHARDLNVWRMDPSTLERSATIAIDEPLRGLAFADDRLWVTTWTSLFEIDPTTNTVIGTTRLMKVPTRGGPAGVVVLGDSVWVAIEGD